MVGPTERSLSGLRSWITVVSKGDLDTAWPDLWALNITNGNHHESKIKSSLRQTNVDENATLTTLTSWANGNPAA